MSASLDDVQTIPRVGNRLTDLSHRVYRLNVRMLELFERGLLGDEAPESFEADLPWLAFGAQGPAVTELQRALLHAGYDVTPDGSFGPATHSAIRLLQHDHDLVVDGVVGPQTSAIVARYLR